MSHGFPREDFLIYGEPSCLMNHIRAASLRGKKVEKEKGKKTLPSLLRILNDDS